MIGERLKLERERLGLTQVKMAEITAATKRTVITWEQGVTSPNAVQLSALGESGFDLLFILTGCQRSQPSKMTPLEVAEDRIGNDHYLWGARTASTEALSARETALLDNYRNIEDDEDKRAVERTALMAARAAMTREETQPQKKTA